MEDFYKIFVTAFLGGGVLSLALTYLLSLWIGERFKSALLKENEKFYETLRWETKAREQAVKVAEYLSISLQLKKESNEDLYRRANQLGWELAMWLPEEIYRSMSKAIINHDENVNPLTVVLEVRKHFLGSGAGDLSQADIMMHGPGIGEGSR